MPSATPSKAPENQPAPDGTSVGVGAGAATAEKAILSAKSDADPAGSVYGDLALRMKKTKKNSISIKWNNIGEPTYVVYGAPCGKNNSFQKLATVSGTSFTQNGLKKGKVKAVGKGTAYVYVYAQNGAFTKVKFKVK